MREGAIRRDQDRRCQRRGKHKRAHGSSAAHSGLEAGGKYGLVLLALPGAAGANVTGSTSAFVQSAAVNYLQGLGAAQVKQIADSLGRDPRAEAARAALHGIVGCAGAAGQGAACASGALGASAGGILNSLMASPEGLTSKQVEARRNLVTSLVAGIASVAGPGAATAGTAAGLGTSQNGAQLAIPAVGAAAAKCATTPSCQRAAVRVGQAAYQAVQANRMIDAAEGSKATTAQKEAASAQIQARVKLVASLVAGLNAALGGDRAVATLAAQIETENNYFGQNPRVSGRSNKGNLMRRLLLAVLEILRAAPGRASLPAYPIRGTKSWRAHVSSLLLRCAVLRCDWWRRAAMWCSSINRES